MALTKAQFFPLIVSESVDVMFLFLLKKHEPVPKDHMIANLELEVFKNGTMLFSANT